VVKKTVYEKIVPFKNGLIVYIKNNIMMKVNTLQCLFLNPAVLITNTVKAELKCSTRIIAKAASGHDP
jgi:rRNA-processing protein FCF1